MFVNKLLLCLSLSGCCLAPLRESFNYLEVVGSRGPVEVEVEVVDWDMSRHDCLPDINIVSRQSPGLIKLGRIIIEKHFYL